MSDRKFNRWLVVIGALLVQISLGAIFIYSIYKPYLKEYFSNWDNTDLALPSQIVLAMFAISMIASGKIQDRYGPRILASFGGVLLGTGMIIASFASNLTVFVLGYSVIGGLGIGAAYVCPIATCVKWFPDKRGFITGLSVAGFGAGALVYTPITKYLISTVGVMNTFWYLGIIFLGCIVIGSQFLKIPAPNYKPRGWEPEEKTSSNVEGSDYSSKEMVNTYQFWFLWVAYFAGCTSGLMIIMNITNIWQSFSILNITDNALIIKKNIFDGIISEGADAIVFVSVFNAFGRIFWGKVSDIIGRKNTLIIMYLFCSFAMFSLIFLNSYFLFLCGVSSVGFCFGGYLALFPAITADYFGIKYLGGNYGLIYTAYGVGGLFGPFIAPKLMIVINQYHYEASYMNGTSVISIFSAGSYFTSFIISGVLCLIAAILISLTKKIIIQNNVKDIIS